jgi:hypothetical protein
VQRDEYLGEKAKQYMRDNPLRSLRLAAVKIARTWSPMPLSDQFSRPLYIAIALAFCVPMYLLAMAGLASNYLPASSKVFLAVPAMYFTLAAALSVGSLRYRVPAEVPMAVLAAAGLPALARRGAARVPQS